MKEIKLKKNKQSKIKKKNKKPCFPLQHPQTPTQPMHFLMAKH
jgi:hypothetical protein